MTYKIEFKNKADEDFLKIDGNLRKFFSKHLEKVATMPPRRHLKHGLPFFVEEVTKQASLVYELEDETQTLFVVRCFALHKDYEKWYQSFK